MGIFGPSRKEIWQKLSADLNARYVSGHWGTGDKVQIDHGGWTLTLDTYVVPAGKTMVVFTRMRAPFVNPTGFRFRVYRKSIFTGLGKWFGMQDIEIGEPPFDDGFVIQSADETRVRELLRSPRMRDLIAQQKDIELSIKDDEGFFGTKFPDGVDELHFVTLGIIKDIDRLKLLYELFAETLGELVRIGAASDTPPNVNVK